MMEVLNLLLTTSQFLQNSSKNLQKSSKIEVSNFLHVSRRSIRSEPCLLLWLNIRTGMTSEHSASKDLAQLWRGHYIWTSSEKWDHLKSRDIDLSDCVVVVVVARRQIYGWDRGRCRVPTTDEDFVRSSAVTKSNTKPRHSTLFWSFGLSIPTRELQYVSKKVRRCFARTPCWITASEC